MRPRSAQWWLLALAGTTAASLSTSPAVHGLLAAASAATIALVLRHREARAPHSTAGARSRRVFGILLLVAAWTFALRWLIQLLFGPKPIFSGTPPRLAEALTAGVGGLRPVAIVMCFGLAAVLADHRALLRRAPRGLMAAAAVVTMALSLAPKLATALERVRLSAKLRGRSRGPGALRSILVPTLEAGLEAAAALGGSMASRGFGSGGASWRPSSDRLPVRVQRLSVRYPQPAGGEVLALPPIDFVAAAGSLTIVTGPTGSGKTSLLRALAGLAANHDGAVVSGAVSLKPDRATLASHQTSATVALAAEQAVDQAIDLLDLSPQQLAGTIGYVAQNPRESFIEDTVAEELAFGLRQLRPRLSEGEVGLRVRELAKRFDLEALLRRDLATLSGGEAQLVAIAAASATGSRVLLLDEPTARLDSAATRRLVGLLDHLCHEAGLTVIASEHHPERLAAIAKVTIALPGPAWRDFAPAPSPNQPTPSLATPRPRANLTAAAGPPTLTATDLTVHYPDATAPAVTAASLTLHTGQITTLTGPNGSGKTSLLWALHGAGRRDGGSVTLHSPKSPALVPQIASDLLFLPTVAAELRESDSANGLAPGTTARMLDNLGGLPGTRGHPRDLSLGQQLTLVLAITLAAEPPILLLDEPTTGLDTPGKTQLAANLGLLAQRGLALLVASHDGDFLAMLAGHASGGLQRLTMRGGVLGRE